MACIPVTLPKHGAFSILRICTGLLGTLTAPLFAAAAPEEFEVKAAFLCDFARFVEWPREAFESNQSAVTIGILGADPFGNLLESMAKSERVKGRPITVVHYQTVAEISCCHLLFISGTEGPRIAAIMSALRGRPILTVCDWERPGDNAAMIRFALAKGRMRLLVNFEAAKAAGLAVSSKLLRTAELVGGPDTQP